MSWLKDLFSGKPHHPPAQILDDEFEWPFVLLSPAPGWGHWTIRFWQNPWREKKGRRDGIQIDFQGSRDRAMARCRELNDDLLRKWLKRKKEEREEKQKEHDELATERGTDHIPGPYTDCPACQ